MIMEQADSVAPKSGADIRQAWADLQRDQPKMRARDAAAALGVSEAALIASQVGERAVRLDGDFGELLARLPAVGTIMALTRNDHVVHEKVGEYGNVTVQPGHGIVLNHDIDLRLFMSHWRHGFEVADTLQDGSVRRSFQFFDAAGVAVHKVFTRAQTNLDAWAAITADFAAAEQVDTVTTLPLPALPSDLADTDIDVAGLRAHWAALQDTHDFFGMLKDFKVGRHQAMRLAGDDFVEPVAPAAARAMLEGASNTGAPIMCFVGNRGCIQIHTGPVKSIKVMGPWLNVLDPGFNLHLREDHIAHAYIVRKPTRDGDVTSLELFDETGKNFVMFFGERKPGNPELESWRALLKALPRREAAVA